MAELREEAKVLRKHQFNSTNVREQEDTFRSFTGLSPDKFDVRFEYCNPGNNAENIKYYEASKTTSSVDMCKFKESSKPGSRPKLDVIEQLFQSLFTTP